ncbi:MAG: folate-binding protein [Lysobacteraceae bacterium]|nr:MAG: folate-binding protein [Xanthomonadaceae bacterium]
MPDNPHRIPSAPFRPEWFALTDHQIVELTGRDAVGFAQAQFINDVAALDDGGWQWNGWLTPKGRLIALFALLRIESERLWILLSDMAADELVEQLRRYVFRSKVRIGTRADLHASGFPRASLLASGGHWVGDPGISIELDFSGRLTPLAQNTGRSLRISSARGIASSAALDWWATLDLIHGLPRLEASQRALWTPQQLSLERLRAYSLKKGCYPGQEIVARTHFLGQAKRGLGLLRTNTPLQPGQELRDGERVIGHIVASRELYALAVLPLGDDLSLGVSHANADGTENRREIIKLAEGLER